MSLNINKLLDIEKVSPQQLRFIYRLVNVSYNKNTFQLKVENKMNPEQSTKYFTLTKNDYKRFKCAIAKQVVMNLIYDYIVKTDNFSNYEILRKLEQVFVGVNNTSQINKNTRYGIYLNNVPYYISNDDISRFNFENLYNALVLIINNNKAMHG